MSLVGQLPEQLALGFGSQMAYAFARGQTLSFGADFSSTWFDAVELVDDGTDPGSDPITQSFQTIGVNVGYGWNFARNSDLQLTVGAQVAFGDTDAALADPTAGDNDTDIIPLPTGSFVLNWFPVMQREIVVGNRIEATVLGSPDPTLGTFQPRLNAGLGFELSFPPKTSLQILGSLSMPLAPPPDGQIGLNVGLGAGDSQVDVTIPLTYRFSDSIVGSIGGRFTYFFNRFGADPAEGEAAPPIDDSLVAEGFIAFEFALVDRSERGRHRTRHRLRHDPAPKLRRAL